MKKWFAKLDKKYLGSNESKEYCAGLYNKEAIEKYGKNYERLNKNENGELIWN